MGGSPDPQNGFLPPDAHVGFHRNRNIWLYPAIGPGDRMRVWAPDVGARPTNCPVRFPESLGSSLVGAGFVTIAMFSRVA